MKAIGDIISSALNGIVDVFPQIADFEDEENLPYPFAVYRVDETGAMTKEGPRSGQYTANIAVVSDGYDAGVELVERVKHALQGASTSEVRFVFVGVSTDYDEEDRAYIMDINFTVKKYK